MLATLRCKIEIKMYSKGASRKNRRAICSIVAQLVRIDPFVRTVTGRTAFFRGAEEAQAATILECGVYVRVAAGSWEGWANEPHEPLAAGVDYVPKCCRARPTPPPASSTTKHGWTRSAKTAFGGVSKPENDDIERGSAVQLRELPTSR